MAFIFENKKILIISPQSWGNLFTSKQHYALELEKLGNKVFFLNPPMKKIGFDIYFDKVSKNIDLISYQLPFPYNIRFHTPNVFNKLFQKRLYTIYKNISNKFGMLKFDVVWCFDNNLSYDLRIFNGSVKIFHIVDNLAKKHRPKTAYTADIILGVSEYLINSVNEVEKPKYFINHGLSSFFIDHAIKNLEYLVDEKTKNKKINFGYSGNLFLDSLDRTILLNIIKSNPAIEFHFWGTKDKKDDEINFDKLQFVNSLSHLSNTKLYGSVMPDKLAEQIQMMDGFIVCLDNNLDINRGSNSHKILEYLSTGKVIVSNYISTYADKDLIVMASKEDKNSMQKLFSEVINNIDTYNSAEHRKKRIEYALNNTYKKQIFRIGEIISGYLI